MELAATSSPTFGSLLELIETQGQEADGIEGFEGAEEGVDPEMLKNPEGSLSGATKQFSCTPQMRSLIPEKVVDYITTFNKSQEKQKPIDLKSSDHLSSSKESFIKQKEFTVLQPHPQNLEGGKKEDKGETKSFVKSDHAGREALAKGEAPPSARQLKESAAVKQQQNMAKTLEQRIQKEFGQKESKKTADNERKNSESRREAQERERAREQNHLQMQHLHKKEEREQERQGRQQREEEEGFTEGEREQQQSQGFEEDERKKTRVERVAEKQIKEIQQYGLEDSILSEIFKMRVSQFDVILLFIEIMKLDIRGREQERIARRQEREMQLIHMQNVVENFKSQAQMDFSTGLGAGIFGIAAGALPIIGHMHGEWIIEKFGSVFSSMKDQKKDKLFHNFAKMAHGLSEMQKSTGQVYDIHAQGSRTFDQHMSELHKSDGDENTRAMEEIKDNWKNIENMILTILQSMQEEVRQLYH